MSKSLDTLVFWRVIEDQLTELRTARTAADVLRILATADNPYGDPHISSSPAFFAGGGGDGSVMEALTVAGWTVTWAEASYHYEITAPDGSVLTYCEGDIFPGKHT
jgi:hypothetical protein